jgi:hypothetical protein
MRIDSRWPLQHRQEKHQRESACVAEVSHITIQEVTMNRVAKDGAWPDYQCPTDQASSMKRAQKLAGYAQ